MMPSASYSRLDRLLHVSAFRGIGMQKSLADLEERMFAKHLDGIEVGRPVFITSLPRAGTTLLLEVVASHPGFVSHTYRNMPFLLCPLLWEQISRGFRRPSAQQERAHGDGVAVGYDSPEAFEEVLWKAFWPDHYGKEHITTWKADERDEEFEAFLLAHIRKIRALARREDGTAPAYVSKNNANIARLGLIQRLFPAAPIVLPFRHPLDQARSFLRQHDRFLEIHGQDPFSLRYMEWLGHYEFGRALRPIDFGSRLGADANGAPEKPESLAFWVRYWCCAFAHILEKRGPGVLLIDYDRMCTEPGPALETMACALGLAPEAFATAAQRFRAPTSYDGVTDAVPSELRERALDLHGQLRAVAAA